MQPSHSRDDRVRDQQCMAVNLTRKRSVGIASGMLCCSPRVTNSWQTVDNKSQQYLSRRSDREQRPAVFYPLVGLPASGGERKGGRGGNASRVSSTGSYRMRQTVVYKNSSFSLWVWLTDKWRGNEVEEKTHWRTVAYKTTGILPNQLERLVEGEKNFIRASWDKRCVCFELTICQGCASKPSGYSGSGSPSAVPVARYKLPVESLVTDGVHQRGSVRSSSGCRLVPALLADAYRH